HRARATQPTTAPASRSGAAARPSACRCRSASETRCRRGSASVAQPVVAADIAIAMAEALGHHRGEILVGRRDPAAGAHSVALGVARLLRSFAGRQCPGRSHDQLAELDDADVGRTEMLAGAVLHRALAVLDRGVLLADAGDAREGVVLLHLAVDQVLVPEI